MQTITPPAQPVRVRPLWERSELFREPVYPDGLTLLEDDEDDESGD